MAVPAGQAPQVPPALVELELPLDALDALLAPDDAELAEPELAPPARPVPLADEALVDEDELDSVPPVPHWQVP
jgi:hypothetical protein